MLVASSLMIASFSDLIKHLELRKDEEEWFCKNENALPLLISGHLLSLMDKNDKNDPIRLQFVPSSLELKDEIGDLDPLEEVKNSSKERLIHRYHNRAALLVTDRCFSYCRHCFRRRFTSTMAGAIKERELDEICEYLKEHREIKEVLLTGGDMFTLSDNELDVLLSKLKDAREDIIYRLCTRAVVSYPERFTDALFSVIRKNSKGAPYTLMTQINHPSEMDDSTARIINSFLDLHICAFNQAVLLKGVNDSLDTLINLSYRLLANRIKPYYLFQGDMVRGTAHMRVAIDKGLELERELRKAVSGLAMPQYTIDLPEGGGKVILTTNYVEGKTENSYIIKSPFSGEKREYFEKRDD